MWFDLVKGKEDYEKRTKSKDVSKEKRETIFDAFFKSLAKIWKTEPKKRSWWKWYDLESND